MELSPSQHQIQGNEGEAAAEAPLLDDEEEELEGTKEVEYKESQDMFEDSPAGINENTSSQCGQVWGSGIEEDERVEGKLGEKRLSVVEEESKKSGLAQKEENRSPAVSSLRQLSARLAVSGSESESDSEDEESTPKASTPMDTTPPLEEIMGSHDLRDRKGPGCQPPEALNMKATESQVDAVLASAEQAAERKAAHAARMKNCMDHMRNVFVDPHSRLCSPPSADKSTN